MVFASMPSTATFMRARAEIQNLLCELASNAKIWRARASEHSFKFCEQLKILMDHSSPLAVLIKNFLLFSASKRHKKSNSFKYKPEGGLYLGKAGGGGGGYNQMYFFCLQVDGPINARCLK